MRFALNKMIKDAQLLARMIWQRHRKTDPSSSSLSSVHLLDSMTNRREYPKQPGSLFGVRDPRRVDRRPIVADLVMRFGQLRNSKVHVLFRGDASQFVFAYWKGSRVDVCVRSRHFKTISKVNGTSWHLESQARRLTTDLRNTDFECGPINHTTLACHLMNCIIRWLLNIIVRWIW